MEETTEEGRFPPKPLASSSVGPMELPKPTVNSTGHSPTTIGAGIMPSREFYRATSLLSIWGPCRRIGDEYLSCVVTEGMGMCKPLRGHFERCATETAGYSMAMLDQLAMQTESCQQWDSLDPDNKAAAMRNCAADLMLKQQNVG